MIEISASGIVAWRLAAEKRAGCTQATDGRATRLIALSFFALAGYVGFESVERLLSGDEPETSIVGIILTSLSLMIMPFLARAKRRVAPALGSRAQEAEANQAWLCVYMSAVVLFGLVVHAAFGWWWADPAAGIGTAALAAVEGLRTWRAESLEDTCCG